MNKIVIVKNEEQADQSDKIYEKTFLKFRFISKPSTEKSTTEILRGWPLNHLWRFSVDGFDMDGIKRKVFK